ncbi:bifunctional cytidylyltransferase/SDR family oxidoreductase [Parabacteroides distasonis]|uniref:Bifunctional cytidylyltransferase/SDR family oxidoreductase n=1 Tax=Parabacteroides distasonis TaxID=823 RepID=A0A7L5EBD9_PARDI|nr:bifunctional cytidylyltransferase/SDR family oxidoreductase [Parabacteroides distasonis]QJE27330.1 bifunctional cytidylyltransferase/SDR family oxidoreductase [Parabacteroides distasonis]WRY43092.1 bifunctional cytidylyltransferase/SDR family oxidoreductase [Parabacteroides distasonis]
MKNIAVILAGGTGQRLGDPVPKQFLKVAGKKVIEHTLDVFQNHSLIDEIAVVSHPHHVSDVEALQIKNHYTKLKKILQGGKERYHSSLAAINAYDMGEEINLIFHDAVRPLVNDRIISDCISALETYNAVDVAIKTTDTIIQTDDTNCISGIPAREQLRNGQTPQAFKLSVIKQAYELALQDPKFKTTDDCGVVYKYLPEEPVHIIEGEQFNMKLTYKEDLFLLDKLFQLRSVIQQGEKLTVQAKQKLSSSIIVVFGGSYGIGKDIVDICSVHGAHVYSFSRSTTGTDVSDRHSVIKALKLVYEKEGRIDAVVNTAGILDKEPLANMSYEEVFKSINVNYLGAVIVAKESYSYLKENQGALLLFTSSSYTRGRSLYSLYSSSKAAIVNFVQALSEEWHDFGVRVNCINPERTKTPMRVKSFGMEPENTLLKSEVVAFAAINTIFSSLKGEVIDVKR